MSMSISPGALLDRARSPEGQKLIKYSAVSVISVIVSLVILTFCTGALRWSATVSNVTAVGLSAIPSYYLNRSWAWGKSGRSHLLKEVVPFWALAFLGLLISTWWVAIAERWAHHAHVSHLVLTGSVDAANLSAFGVLWIAKFVIFNKLLFAHHPEELEDIPALDGRSGLPT
jgi:putative flippase GtrA